MPKPKQLRCQMDMRPLAGVCFSVGTNAVFIFNGGKKHHFGMFVKEFFALANPVSQSLSNGRAMLN
jgi:hypothetical protein